MDSTTNTTSNSADDMQEAFQAFMLSGGAAGSNHGSGKKKKKKPSTPSQSTPSPHARMTNTPSSTTSTSYKDHQRSVQKQKTKKQYCQILNHFRKTLQEDWIAVDDNLGLVVASIVNLRDRIHLTSKYLWQWENNPPPPPSSGVAYRPPRVENAALGYLLPEDLELALSHGLIQHEKMLGGTRKLVSSLNQAQDALGRRLDELLLFHLEWGPMLPELDGSLPEDVDENGIIRCKDRLELFAAHVVYWCETVFRALADELYRKQCLVQTLLDSIDDGLLYRESDEDLLADDVTPRSEATKCLKAWPRGGSKNRDYLEQLLSSTPWEESGDDEVQ